MKISTEFRGWLGSKLVESESNQWKWTDGSAKWRKTQLHVFDDANREGRFLVIILKTFGQSFKVCVPFGCNGMSFNVNGAGLKKL